MDLKPIMAMDELKFVILELPHNLKKVKK